MLLSYEDAYFYKLILQGGFYQEVNEWIDNIAINNDLLRGIYLDLVCNQNNLNELISCLHNYIGNNKIDDKFLCDRLRLFIKEKLEKNEISYEDAANSLCEFAITSDKWEEAPWSDFYMLSVYSDYMDDGFLDIEDYHKIVKEFIDTGELLHSNDFWKKREIKCKRRCDKGVIKKNIILKLIVGIFVVAISIVGFILIENNETFNKLYIQIISVCIFIVGLTILALIAKDLKRLDIEKNYEQIEKYISDCNSYISILYKMHLNNDLIIKLAEKNIDLFNNYPIVYEDEYVIEIINKDKKLIIKFYENKVMYTILKIDKYEFDVNEEEWKEISNISFENDEQIIDFIVDKYQEIS